MIVLDTDHLSCLEWGSEESANLRARLAEASDRKIVVSIASYEEQMRGWLALLASKAGRASWFSGWLVGWLAGWLFLHPRFLRIRNHSLDT